MDETLHHRLSSLAIGRVPVPASARGARSQPAPLPPGSETRTAHGSFYLVETPLDEASRDADESCFPTPPPPWSVPGPDGERHDVPRPVFFDIETTGFAACPLFLTATIDLEKAIARQRFARDYTEERAVVAATIDELGDAGAVVSFNGRSYDLPFLRNRASYHRLPFAAAPLHFDLLHLCRRAWKGRYPDFRLQTLERTLGRKSRAGDIPGAEIPSLYHSYVRRGHDARIGVVFRHNLKDVLTLVRLFFLLAEEGRERRGPR